MRDIQSIIQDISDEFHNKIEDAKDSFKEDIQFEVKWSEKKFSALISLLWRKGIITKEEWVKALEEIKL